MSRVIDLLRWVAAALLLVLPLYLAWDYGGIVAWSRWLATVVVAGAAVLCIPVMFQRAGDWRRRLLLIPLIFLAIWGIAALQGLPLEESTVRRLSPGSAAAYEQWVTAEQREQALAAAPLPRDVASIAAGRHPISIGAELTRVAQSGPALFAVVCLLASLLFRTRAAIVSLLLVVALSGGAIAFLGIADQIRAPALEGNASVLTPEVSRAAPFGPFVCRNNAAGYLNLTLAAAIGLLVYRFGNSRTSGGEWQYQPQPETWWDRPLFLVQSLLLRADAATLGALILIVLNVAGVLSSGSRGGTLAVISGTLVAVMLAGGQRAARGWRVVTMVLCIIGVAILLGSLGLIAPVAERLETLWGDELTSDGRLDHWPDSLAAAWHYFPAGSGLGTYRYAYLPFQQTSSGAWFVNADNMALEWLVEGGIWLLPLVLAAVALFAMELQRLAQVRGAAHLVGLITAGWFVIGSQLVAEFFDFGILLPANHVTLALLVGAVLGAGSRRYSRSRHSLGPRGIRRVFATLALPACFVLVLVPLGLAHRVTQQAAADDHAIRQWGRSAGGGPLSAEFADEVLAVSNNPTLHLAVAGRLLADEVAAGRAALAELDPQQTLDHSQLASIEARRVMYYLQAAPAGQGAEAALLPGQSLARIQAAHQHALRALLLCPLSDVARFELLRSGFAVEQGPAATQVLLQQWGQLRCRYAPALERAARLAAVYPGRPAAVPLIQQLLWVDPGRVTAMWPVFGLLGDEAVISELLPDDPQLLLRVLETRTLGPPLRETLVRRLQRLLGDEPGEWSEAVWADAQGRVARLLLDDAQAETWFQRAVTADPSTTLYRFRLAETLERNGKRGAAIEQLQQCLLQDPTNRHYQNRLAVWQRPGR